MSALLGAWKAQMNLEIAAIGGKDSMSGTFENIDVPPTLISFAVSTVKTDNVMTAEFKKAGHAVWQLSPEYDENGEPVYISVKSVFDEVEALIREKKVRAVWTTERGGAAEGVFKMMLGNRIGFKAADGLDKDSLFARCAGSFILETEADTVIAGAAGAVVSMRRKAIAVSSVVRSVATMRYLPSAKPEGIAKLPVISPFSSAETSESSNSFSKETV